MAKKQPEDSISIGGTRAAIWSNEGENGVWYNVTVTRRYKTDDGWQDSNSYTPDDLLALAKVADLAHTRCLEMRKSNQSE